MVLKIFRRISDEDVNLWDLVQFGLDLTGLFVKFGCSSSCCKTICKHDSQQRSEDDIITYYCKYY